MKNNLNTLILAVTTVIVAFGIGCKFPKPEVPDNRVTECDLLQICSPLEGGKTDFYFDEQSLNYYTHNRGVSLNFKYRAAVVQNSAANAKIRIKIPNELRVVSATLTHSETTNKDLSGKPEKCIFCENTIICEPENRLNFERVSQEMDNHYLVKVETKLKNNTVNVSECIFNISGCVGNNDIRIANNNYDLEIANCQRLFIVIPEEDGPEILPRDVPEICKYVSIIEDCYGGIEPYLRNNSTIDLEYRKHIDQIQTIRLFEKNKLIKELNISKSNSILSIPIKGISLRDIRIEYIKKADNNK